MTKNNLPVTEAKRKEEIRRLNLYMAILAAVVCSYIGGYACSIMYEEQSDLIPAVLFVINRIGEGDYIYRFSMTSLPGLAAGLIAGIAVFVFLQNDSELNYHYNKETVAGNGGFMEKKDLADYNRRYVEERPYTDPVTGEVQPWCDPNMILGQGIKRSVFTKKTERNNNMLIIGGSGTKKTYGYIKPNILQMNGSFVVTDPSGEIVRSLGNVLKDRGYRIRIFNIVDMCSSNTYNPFEYIREESDVLNMVDCFIRNTTNKDEGKGEKFWTDSEKLLYSACIFYLRDHCSDHRKKNFASVFNMINASSNDESGNSREESDLDRLFLNCPKESLAYRYYRAFKQSPAKTRMGIIISCLTRLQPFMMKDVISLTSSDNLGLDRLGDEKTALFIITPQTDNNPYYFLVSMLYSQLFDTLYYRGMHKGIETGDEALTYPVFCLMDEFANIGTIPGFPSKLSTMRKYSISASIVIQDLSQLKTMYKDEYETLIANCDGLLFLGTSAQETLKYISDRLGFMTVTAKSRGRTKGAKSGTSGTWQQTKREVMPPEEIGRMSNDACLIFTRGERPICTKKYLGKMHPLWKETGGNNLFQFTKMKIYDNSHATDYESLLMARMESELFEMTYLNIKRISESGGA